MKTTSFLTDANKLFDRMIEYAPGGAEEYCLSTCAALLFGDKRDDGGEIADCPMDCLADLTPSPYEFCSYKGIALRAAKVHKAHPRAFTARRFRAFLNWLLAAEIFSTHPDLAAAYAVA